MGLQRSADKDLSGSLPKNTPLQELVVEAPKRQ